MGRRLVVSALVWLCAMAAFAGPPRYAGRPLRDALRDLEGKGLHLIYSSDVVRDDMIVGNEPRSTDPRRVLDELLREHQLHASNGPHGSLLIVRDKDQRSSPQSEPSPAAERPAMPTALDSIVVTPSRFTIFTSQAEQHQFLSREEVRSLPHFSDDLFRAIDRIPGMTGPDVSARINARGGGGDEVEVLLDGAEVYDPFHVRDLFRAFSSIDAEAIGAVDVLTGGFPVQYGGRLSGVIDVSSLTPGTPRHTEAGLGFLNARLLSAGTSRTGDVDWLFSVRWGYLHDLLQLVDNGEETINPNYYDLLGKLEVVLDQRNVVSGNVFLSGDQLRVHQGVESLRGIYRDRYAWMNLRSAFTPRLFSQTVVSAGRLATHRTGNYGTTTTVDQGAVNDDRGFEFITIRNDSSFDLSKHNLVKFGFTAKRLRARYDYAGEAVIRESLLHVNESPYPIVRNTALVTDGHDLAAYAADRAALTDRFVVEAGARVDGQSYAPGGAHLAPRLNAAYAISDRATIHAGWGRFFQAQGLQELPVEDGVTSYARSERSDQIVLGLDYALGHGLSVRTELYDKRFSQLRPRFENMFDSVTFFPELRGDRIRIAPQGGLARGGELLLRKDNTTPLSGWITYTRASVYDTVDGINVARSWDQRDTFGFSVNWRSSTRWNFDVAGIFHSGWPTTPVYGVIVNGTFHTVAGPLNSNRLPAYRRIDVRASRNFPTSHGGFSLFVELFNALDWRNVARVDGYTFNIQPDGTLAGRRQTDAILQILPSFGITYTF